MACNDEDVDRIRRILAEPLESTRWSFHDFLRGQDDEITRVAPHLMHQGNEMFTFIDDDDDSLDSLIIPEIDTSSADDDDEEDSGIPMHADVSWMLPPTRQELVLGVDVNYILGDDVNDIDDGVGDVIDDGVGDVIDDVNDIDNGVGDVIDDAAVEAYRRKRETLLHEPIDTTWSVISANEDAFSAQGTIESQISQLVKIESRVKPQVVPKSIEKISYVNEIEGYCHETSGCPLDVCSIYGESIEAIKTESRPWIVSVRDSKKIIAIARDKRTLMNLLARNDSLVSRVSRVSTMPSRVKKFSSDEARGIMKLLESFEFTSLNPIRIEDFYKLLVEQRWKVRSNIDVREFGQILAEAGVLTLDRMVYVRERSSYFSLTLEEAAEKKTFRARNDMQLRTTPPVSQEYRQRVFNMVALPP